MNEERPANLDQDIPWGLQQQPIVKGHRCYVLGRCFFCGGDLLNEDGSYHEKKYESAKHGVSAAPTCASCVEKLNAVSK